MPEATLKAIRGGSTELTSPPHTPLPRDIAASELQASVPTGSAWSVPEEMVSPSGLCWSLCKSISREHPPRGAAGSRSASLHDVPRTVPGAHVRVNCPAASLPGLWLCAEQTLPRPQALLPPWLLAWGLGNGRRASQRGSRGRRWVPSEEARWPRRSSASCPHMGGKETGALGRGQALGPQALPPHKPRVRLAPGKEAGQAAGPRGEGRSCPGRGWDLGRVICKAFLRGAGEALWVVWFLLRVCLYFPKMNTFCLCKGKKNM